MMCARCALVRAAERHVRIVLVGRRPLLGERVADPLVVALGLPLVIAAEELREGVGPAGMLLRRTAARALQIQSHCALWLSLESYCQVLWNGAHDQAALPFRSLRLTSRS